MKHLIILFIICFNISVVFSQDIIHLKNGNKIEAKVTEIGKKEVKFKKYDFQNGPDYVLYRKEIAFISFENGKKEMFFGKLTKDEYSRLCERKIIHYTKQQNFGMWAASIGTAAIIGVGIANYNYTIRNHYYDFEQQLLYDAGFVLSAGAIVGGAALFLGGRHKVNQYSEKLKGISFGFNFNEKQKIFSLAYRF